MYKNWLIDIKRKLRRYIGFILTPSQCLRLSSYFFRIKQILDPEEREYFKIKTFSTLDFNNRKNGAKVIILGLRSFSTYNLSVFEKVLSDFLKYNGAEVKILLCDSVLNSCDADIKGCAIQKATCYRCRREREQYKKLYLNTYLSFVQFISPEEMAEAKTIINNLKDEELPGFKYLGVNLSRYAIESTVKYFRKGNFDAHNPEHLTILRHNILQGLLSLNIAKNVIAKEKPTHFISLHGCYVSWGPFTEYCSKNGVHITIHAYMPHKIGYCMFTTSEKYDSDIPLNLTIENKKLWDSVKDKELSKDQKEEAKVFLLQKKQGKTVDYKLYNMGKNSICIDKIQSLLNSGKKKYALYPNLLWDTGLEAKGSKLFKDIYDWMYRTIAYFIQNSDYYLLIKPHPGEASIDYTDKGVNEVILEHFGSLPENIILIPKDYPLTSFDLADKGCIGITYNGTVGLECSYFKNPVLVGGNSHYVEAGVTVRVNSLNEYFNHIKDPKSLQDYPNNNFSLIEKYTYFYYFRLLLDIPFLRKDMWLEHWIDWGKLSNYEEFIKNNRIMNYIARAIINKQPIMSPDNVLNSESTAV